MMISFLQRFRQNNRATVAIVFSLSAFIIFGAAGMALDYGRAFSDRSKLQAALDYAVIAGLQAPSAERETTALKILNNNFQNTNGTIAATSFQIEADGSMVGKAAANVPTTLMSVLGFWQILVDVTSKAKPLSDPDQPPPCLNLLDRTKWYTLRLRDGSNIAGPACEVHVHSTRADSSAGFESTTNVEFKRVCLAGGADTLIVNKEEKCAVSPDTFAGRLLPIKVAECDHNDETINDPNTTLYPGVYCGETLVSGSVTNLTFEPGLYVISGGKFSLSAQAIVGIGVTFYFADQDATIEMSGVNSAQLEAPNSGDQKDILMFQPDGLKQATVEFQNTNNQSWKGIIHVPSWDFRITNVSNWDWNVNLVAYSMEIDLINKWTVATYLLKNPHTGVRLSN